MYKALWIILCCVGAYLCKEKFRQESAQAKYVNPKYIRNVTAYTGRLRRGATYKTNVTATTLHPWGNNVTLEISCVRLPKSSLLPMVLKLGICDALKIGWMKEFAKGFTNITTTTCPVPGGTYRATDIELPPKNWPWPYPKGKYRLDIQFFLTATEEYALKLSAMVTVF